MFLNTCRKVVVIDDRIEEALPLIKLLSGNGATALYYSGQVEELPSEPIDGIRLVFCDLKFSVTADSKNVISNVVSILKKVISENNGPYILLIWSTHQNDYTSDLQAALDTEKITPAFILPLDKADFFESKETMAGIQEDIYVELERANLDTGDEDKVKSIIESVLVPANSIIHVPRPNIIQEVSERLKVALTNAQLFHLFVLWEGTIGDSAVQTVNTMYGEMEKFSADKRLRAMFFYLAHNRLEQRFEKATSEEKFWAAMDSLNDLFPYFYTDNIHKLTTDLFNISTIEHLKGVDEISSAKFNRWKIISNTSDGKGPGNVFYDPEKVFEPHGLVKKKKITKESPYEIHAQRILADDVKYLLVDVSSECDIAQDKLYVSRVIPGIMMPCEHYNQLNSEGILGEADYIYPFPVIEIDEKDYCLIFNLNQMFFMNTDKLYGLEHAFAFTEQYWINIKQKAASCVAKHGIESFA